MALVKNKLNQLRYANLDFDVFIKTLYLEKARETYKNLAENIVSSITKSGSVDESKQIILQRCCNIINEYNKNPSIFENIKNVIVTYKRKNYVIISNKQIKFDKKEFSRFYSNFDNNCDFDEYAWNFVYNKDSDLNKIIHEGSIIKCKISDLERICFNEKSGYLHLYVC